MWSPAIALCLLLSVLPGGDLTDPDPQYMVMVPTLLHGGHDEKLCLMLSHLTEPVLVTITLELPTQNVTILEKQVKDSDEDTCVTFTTPKLDSAEVAFIQINVHGDTLHFKSRRTVLIQTFLNLVFLQSDKPIYKPGQTVNFRIVSLDEDFHPVSETFPVVSVQDPQGNRIYQWLGMQTQKGITQGSFHLVSEPQLGTYQLIVEREKGLRVTHSISVEEYVLPKFEVKVTVPPVVSIEDKEVKVTVCGRYTYGKPVLGLIKARVCRKFTSGYGRQCPSIENSVCEEINHHADAKGCYSEVVKTKIFQMRRTGYEMKIIVSATITEDGTGVELTGEGSSEIRTELAKVTFQQLDSHFKRGIPLYGEVLLKDVAGNPMSNETVVIYVNYDGTNFTYTTGPDGTADFSLDTTNFTESSVHLRVRYRTTEHCYSSSWLTPSYGEDSRSIKHYYSRSKSYIKIQPLYQKLQCDHSERVTVHYILTPEGETHNAVFHYVVMAKGSIVSSGKHAVGTDANHESHGDFTFDLNAGMGISPKAKVLVYIVLDSGEVIADSITLNVEKCFENKVQMSFEPVEALPGSQTNLKFHAAKESLCAVKAVDESVLLLKPEADLSAQTVYDLLPVTDLTGYYHDGHFLEEPREDACLNLKPIFMNGVYYTPTSPDWDTDTYSLFKDLGLKVFTNTKIRTPTICQERIQVISMTRESGMSGPSAMALETSGRLYKAEMDVHDAVIETVRRFFPETWIWDLCETDEHGQAVMSLTVPDTITTWKAQSFCTSQESGFGLSGTVSLVTFLPFFLDLIVPYSAIRGEKFILKASVFNYLSQTIRVRILLEKSDHFVATTKNIAIEEYCVKANRQVTVSWKVALTTLGEVEFTVSAETLTGEGLCDNEIVNPTQGRKDTITKHILVEPEGIEKEETKSSMICVKDSNQVNELIEVDLPEHVVEGSARAYFFLIGDIMGTAMQNLGSLLQMPFGCGEQNMVLFTPNIYILEYLNSTKQLTPEIKLKAKNYLTSGYQKQLTYKHPDGSYSAFGSSDREGNTWLTAFVMKSFARARNHIYIEEKLIQDALTWLSLQQKANGCFRSVGTLFNNAMKGGVDDETTLASYITIALLESHLPLTHPVVRNALFCLESSVNADNNIYTKSLMAYAFTLAGKMDIRSQLLQSLKEQAIEKDGTVHWHRKEFSEDSELRRIPHQRAPSVEVEMTSYVLLSYLSKPDVSVEEIRYCISIVSWIIKQQNPMGGFSSTQDTVVALQALALFGSHTVSHDASRKVVLNLGNSPVQEFHVEDSNLLLLQRVALPEIPGKYSVSITGPGCLFLKTALRYNVPHPKGDAAFSISVKPEPEVCDPKSLKSFSIAVNVSYDGNRDSSNMALVEIKLPSGYIPIKSSVKQLTGYGLIKRTESQPDKVIVYFESLTNVTQSFNFLVEQDIHVSNLQPATALIYDYYEKDEFAVTKYSAPCSSKDDESHE